MKAPADTDFRIGGAGELNIRPDMRLAFLSELRFGCRTSTETELQTAAEKYFALHIEDKTYIPFLGSSSGKAVCCAGILLYELPPAPWSLKRTQGHILNFYVVPERRMEGIGTALMEYIISYSADQKISRLFLNATREGERVYRKCGFVECDEAALILDLVK
jgi:GNAT superfamily N-acetyltransferase